MVNYCTFIGRLGRDPEVKYTKSETAICNFNIACSEKWKDKSGTWQEKTEWVKIVAWQRLAEICGEYLSKGSLVYIAGKLQTREWETKDGEKRFTTEIVAREMKMLDGKGGGRKESKPEEKTEQQNTGDDVPF